MVLAASTLEMPNQRSQQITVQLEAIILAMQIERNRGYKRISKANNEFWGEIYMLGDGSAHEFLVEEEKNDKNITFNEEWWHVLIGKIISSKRRNAENPFSNIHLFLC